MGEDQKDAKVTEGNTQVEGASGDQTQIPDEQVKNHPLFKSLQSEKRTLEKESKRLTGELSKVRGTASQVNQLADVVFGQTKADINAQVASGSLSREDADRRIADIDAKATGIQESSLRADLEADGVDLSKPEWAGVKSAMDIRDYGKAQTLYSALRPHLVKPSGDDESDHSASPSPDEKKYSDADIEAAKAQAVNRFIADNKLNKVSTGVLQDGVTNPGTGRPTITEGLRRFREKRN